LKSPPKSATLGMPPSDFRAGAPEIPIRHAVVSGYLGWTLVAVTEKGICLVAFGDDPATLRQLLYNRFPKAEFHDPEADIEALIALVVARIEAPDPRSVDLPLDVRGTAFQRRVWRALQEIPPGETRTYAQIAGAIGQPAAARAVANACGANPVAVLVPCHRVVRTDGRAGGYHWGAERKKRLLDREKPRGQRR
jgi:AraC family transcriptional regulator of adaptative response/methylated-DNA-[protein]-cysteine methyltransferase